MAEDKIRPPATGSFPFYEQGKNVFSIWVKALDAQARVMNEQWLKLKDGTYEAKDWYSAIVKGMELSISTAEDMAHEVFGVPSPPWVSVRYDSKEETPVKLRVTLGKDDVLTASKLSKLGAELPVKNVPTVRPITIKGDAKTIKVVLENADAVEPGQYIGFIMRSTAPEPIAIVTVTRPE